MINRKYIPALSLDWLTPFYDSLVDGPMSFMRMRKNLLTFMGDLNGKKVLDVGCGTGSFSIMIKQKYQAANVIGLDGDPQILEIARAKAKEDGFEIHFEQGLSFDMPYQDASFDFVITNFMLHHLDREAKQQTAVQAYRILRPSGQLFGIDFVEPQKVFGKVVRFLIRRLERVADNLDGFLPVIFRQAGFSDYRQTRPYLFGTISVFQASKS